MDQFNVILLVSCQKDPVSHQIVTSDKYLMYNSDYSDTVLGAQNVWKI